MIFMGNCQEDYKNLGEESFGEQKIITSQMLSQFCKNDAYLKGQVDSLWDEGNITSRKRFNTMPLDEENSFSTTTTTDGRIGFDESTNKNINLLFDDRDGLIDRQKTTALITGTVTDDSVNAMCTLPKTLTSTLYKTTCAVGPWGDMGCNEYWYVGYDKSKRYELKPRYLTNPRDSSIPSVCRAQTFKTKNTGRLEGVTLNLHGGTNTDSPLTVEIRRTQTVDGVLTPVATSELPLCSQEVRFDEVDPGKYTIVFDSPPHVDKDETYAIVVSSPLSPYSNCYGLGGWSAGCHGELYADGNSFLSENNGYSWMLYGKKDNVAYHLGCKAPQDFAFTCHILEENSVYVKDTDYWLYLKPIFSNPVKSIILSAGDNGDSIEYYASNNGVDWTRFGSNMTISFDDHAQVTFIRAKLRTTSTSNAPYINSLNVHLDTEKPLTGYARTPFYAPKNTPMLGASFWGAVNTPCTIDYHGTLPASVEIELVRNRTCTEHFQLIKPEHAEYSLPAIQDLLTEQEYAKAYNGVHGKNSITAYNFLKENTWITDLLSKFNIYVIGTVDSNGNVKPPLFSSLRLSNSPAYPTLSCVLNTKDNTTPDIAYGEWYDYTFDYTNDMIIFSEAVLNGLTSGVLTMEYRPVFIQDITVDEMPFRLDYRVEDYTLDSESLADGVTLRMPPHDPVRRVLVNPDSENPQALYEDVDYTVDYNGKRLVFNNENTLVNGDVIRITYTPDLEDSSLSIGYWFKRYETATEIFAEQSYIEHKT